MNRMIFTQREMFYGEFVCNNVKTKAKVTSLLDEWVHRESNLMLTLSSDKDQERNRFGVRSV